MGNAKDRYTKCMTNFSGHFEITDTCWERNVELIFFFENTIENEKESKYKKVFSGGICFFISPYCVFIACEREKVSLQHTEDFSCFFIQWIIHAFAYRK